MKRSTNLFYTVGSDTNFITFSNYGESLTGNFLSVNTKLFPSHFLCLDIPKLNAGDFKAQREDFIKYIAAYYENKLAFLRDKCIEHDYSVEKLFPLYYLLEAIEKWCEQYGEDFSITHVGDITEQNYNGTYTDIICVINSSEHYTGEIIPNDNMGVIEEKYDSSQTYLYGWSVKNINDEEIYQGPTNYKDIKPILDGNDFYNLDTKISKIKTKISNNDIKFNIIIPLYNVTNIDSASNTSILAESDYLTATYTQNVPLGIWFSGKEPITLSRSDAEYDPSWSLLLSSQFKPFPYSDKSPTEIDSSDKTIAFNTFAEVVTRQNKIIDKFNDLSKEILELKNEHYSILGYLKSIGTSNNIDELCKQITDLTTKVNSLEKQIAELKTNDANLQK